MIYNYCNSVVTKGLNLTCNKSDLKKIDSYTLRNNEFIVDIFICEKCNGLWKKTLFNNEIKWLKVGDVTVSQNEYIPYGSVGYYPTEYFEIEEAYNYDNSIFCGSPQETKSYKGLTCSPKTLKFINKIKEIDCGRLKTEIFICNKCQTKWEITEEFDSQHGYMNRAKKL